MVQIMSMTRQEQLDAVVRNYGEWPDSYQMVHLDTNKKVSFVMGAVKFTDSYNKEFKVYTFTRAEVEDRKAELQNKPSWDDAPEGAKILAYVPCVSQWVFASYEDARPENAYDWFGIGKGEWFLDSGVTGEVIDDWRDTLEKRPEPEPAITVTEVSLEEAVNRDYEGYEPLDLKLGREEVKVHKESAKWNGEGFPPAGIECEYLHPVFGWTECATIGMFRDTMVCAPNGGDFYQGFKSSFRPIKSDREKWKDAALHVEAELHDNYQPYEFAEALYNAGLGKMPDGDQ